MASINLMPGSNPLFGLNALGGALSRFRQRPASRIRGQCFTCRVDRSAATWSKQGAAATTDDVSYFVAGSALSEDGWRDFSPSRVRQLFGDVEWRRGVDDAGTRA